MVSPAQESSFKGANDLSYPDIVPSAQFDSLKQPSQLLPAHLLRRDSSASLSSNKSTEQKNPSNEDSFYTAVSQSSSVSSPHTARSVWCQNKHPGAPVPMPTLIQSRSRKAGFTMFMACLLRHLKDEDAKKYASTKSLMQTCFRQNRSGNPEYASLSQSTQTAIRQLVGEGIWLDTEKQLRKALIEQYIKDGIPPNEAEKKGALLAKNAAEPLPFLAATVTPPVVVVPTSDCVTATKSKGVVRETAKRAVSGQILEHNSKKSRCDLSVNQVVKGRSTNNCGHQIHSQIDERYLFWGIKPKQECTIKGRLDTLEVFIYGQQQKGSIFQRLESIFYLKELDGSKKLWSDWLKDAETEFDISPSTQYNALDRVNAIEKEMFGETKIGHLSDRVKSLANAEFSLNQENISTIL